MSGSQDVISNLMNHADKTKAAIRALSEHYAGKMEAYAKQNASWTDRTSNARNGLHGYVLPMQSHIKVRIAHTMEYGPYLELARQGKHAILEPTAKAHTEQFFKDVETVVKG